MIELAPTARTTPGFGPELFVERTRMSQELHDWGVALRIETVMTPDELIEWFTRKLPLEIGLRRLDIHPDPSVLFPELPDELKGL